VYTIFEPLGQTSRLWFGIAVVPNGDIYAAVTNGDIYKQTGGVGDFISLGQSRNWFCMAAAPNGDVYAGTVKYVAGDPPGDIYKQTGGSGNFEPLGQTSRSWRGMTVAPNGDAYACVYGGDTYNDGDIYKQTGGVGDFVKLNQTPRSWRTMAAAPNGDIYAAEYLGGIYKQTGGIGDFISLDQTSRKWFGMTAAPNGDIYACVGSDNNIYKQTGGIGHFKPLGQALIYWLAMTAAPNGDVYAAVYNGDIYKQVEAITPPIGYRNTVIARLPLSYWRLGEASGQARDETGSHHLAAVNTPSRWHAGPDIVEDGNKATWFVDSSDQRFYIDSPPEYTGIANLTLEFFFRLHTGHEAKYNTLIWRYGYRGGSTNGFYVVHESSNSNTFRFVVTTDAGQLNIHGHPTLNNDQWYYCICEYRAGTANVYIDHTLIATGSLGTTIPALVGWSFKLGYDTPNFADAYGLTGGLDEVAIYDTAWYALPPPPTADFTATPTTGYTPLTINFTDTSTGVPTTWDWDFGDGSTHGTTQNPTHIYTAPGTYTVTLIATNSAGSDTEIKTDYITGMVVDVTTLLLACGYDTSGCVIWGSSNNGVTWTVKYSDASGGRVNRICVGAGQTVLALTQAGNILRSVDGGDTWTDLGVKVAASAAYVGGIVHVSGSIFVANGSRTVDNGDNWTVVVSYTRCIGKFSDGSLIAATTDVLKRSIDGGLTWSADIVHTNPAGGYTGATPYNFLDLGVGIGILVGEVWYDSVSNTRAYITRTTDYGATWPGISYVDMVGSGSPSLLSSRIYDAAGMPAQNDYSVFRWLHVAGLTTPSGGPTTTSNMLKSINIGGAWTAGALASQYFYGLYYSILAAKLFGGLIGSSAIQVSLDMGTSWSTVYTPGSGAQFLDFVDGPPSSVSANFVASPLAASMGELICFDDLSTGSPTSWLWDFGDGHTSILPNPSHQYNAAGTYTVSLIATNSAGSDTETKTAYITISVVDFVSSPRTGLAPLTVQFTDLSV